MNRHIIKTITPLFAIYLTLATCTCGLYANNSLLIEEETTDTDSWEIDKPLSSTGFVPPYPLVAFSYTTGRYISICEPYSSIQLFSPLPVSSYYFPFVNAQLYRFNDNRWAFSGGAGIRTEYWRDNIVGINLYYDALYGCTKKWFKQVGLGLELFFPNLVDIRANGYLSLSTFNSVSCVFDDLGDGFHAESRTKEFAYSGFDAEIGTWVQYSPSNDFGIYVAGGPYYFTKHHFCEFFGGTARVVLNWKSLLYLQGRVSRDNIHSTCWQATIACLIPLDFFWNPRWNGNSDNDQGGFKLPQRNGLILLDRGTKWVWNW